eukprot:s2652_g11.t1
MLQRQHRRSLHGAGQHDPLRAGGLCSEGLCGRSGQEVRDGTVAKLGLINYPPKREGFPGRAAVLFSTCRGMTKPPPSPCRDVATMCKTPEGGEEADKEEGLVFPRESFLFASI